MGCIMDERRKTNRIIPSESSTLDFNGSACFVVDVCRAGLGITFMSHVGWPDEIELKYTLPQESNKVRHIPCHTVWERSMEYYKTGSTEIVRRRGLEFIDPESENVDRLFHHLSASPMTEN